MNQPSSQDLNSNLVNAETVNSSRLLQQGVGFIGGISILGSSLAGLPATATTNSFVVPDTSDRPVSLPKVRDIAPPTPAPSVKPVVKQSSLRAPITQSTPKTQLSAPRVSVPPTSTQTNNSSVSDIIGKPQSDRSVRLAPSADADKNSYIDTIGYSQRRTEDYTAPSAVILSERSSGCTSISRNGKLAGGNCGNVTKKQPVTATRPHLSRTSVQVASRTKSYIKPNRANVGTVVNPPANIALAPVPKYHRATKPYYYPQTLPQQRNTDLIFPVSIPAEITSAFGWRIHPVNGSGRMHAGTDLAAPMGTPVLAAYGGEVAVAESLSGYGLTVILRHVEGTQESRYAHLSEIYVKPGDTVEQGAVIGRVGSTGMSTGPHLHFEWRHLTKNGWVAVDAGLHLEYAMEHLIEKMQMANRDRTDEG
jgi:murein DD-endopeptidase MepM/ murein hydrolase activator NlpD